MALHDVTFTPKDGTTIPHLLFFAFQATFCIVTTALVAGAVVERMRFGPFLVFAAFTAGLFEEGGRWLAFRFLVPPAERQWRTALMLGAGHGGLESMCVGLLVLATLAGYMAVTLLSPETFGAAAPQVEQARSRTSSSQRAKSVSSGQRYGMGFTLW